MKNGLAKGVCLSVNLKVYIESLGCPKNLIDAEVMSGLLTQHEFQKTPSPHDADIIIVNTCGFIEDAKKESIDTMIELSQWKEHGNCKLFVVTGCLAERYAEELAAEMPEADIIIGTGDFPQITEYIQRALEGEKIVRYGNANHEIPEGLPRILSTPGHTAYVKIAEGCDNHCTYCIIPKLRGQYKSRAMQSILEEVESLVSKGVKEIILIAQDTTKYGLDLYGETKLAELLKRIAEIDPIQWIRVLYCYPENISEQLIQTIASEEKICKYLDIPIQHCNDEILKRMNRRTTKAQILKNIERMREKIPNIHIRTSLIVGFPGETEEQFKELKQFVQTVKFDRLGVFTYSQEEGTPAANFPNQIDEEIKAKRREEIMLLQKEISLQKNKEKIGHIYDIMIEENLEKDHVYIGRTMYDAPEVDGVVYVYTDRTLKIGSLEKVRIIDALEYDLLGEMLSESC